MSIDKAPKVFISYKWENTNHQKKVESFARKLRDDGFDAKLDVYQDSKDTDNTDWRLWIDKELPSSDFILIICTKSYKNCFDNNVNCKGEGGVQYEALHIRNKIKDNIIFPILFNQDDKKYIPHLMQSFNRYELINESFDIEDKNSAYNMLVRKLSNQPKYPEPDIGMIPPLLPENKIDDVNDEIASKKVRIEVSGFESDEEKASNSSLIYVYAKWVILFSVICLLGYIFYPKSQDEANTSIEIVNKIDLKGRVVDEKREGIEGYKVYVKNNYKKNATTNHKGFFRIKDVDNVKGIKLCYEHADYIDRCEMYKGDKNVSFEKQ